MKINSDLIWTVILLGLTTLTFFLGMEKGSITAEDQLKNKLEEIKILEIKNEQLSEELKSRGVFSYPQANVVSGSKETTAMVLVTLNGKDPITNLKLRKNLIENYSEQEFRMFSGEGNFIDLGTLKPHNPSAFPISLSNKELSVQLLYESDRKNWHQYMWLRKNTDGKLSSFWIITNENSVIIDKHIDPGFPTDTNGRIQISKERRLEYSELELNSIFPTTRK